MEIQLSPEYQIITDSEQFIVQRFITTTKTVEDEIIVNTSWRTLGYYPQINQALRCISKNILLINKDLDVIVNKLNLLDIKIEEIRSRLENTRINDLVSVMEVSNSLEDESEEYENE